MQPTYGEYDPEQTLRVNDGGRPNPCLQRWIRSDTVPPTETEETRIDETGRERRVGTPKGLLLLDLGRGREKYGKGEGAERTL